jgi:hypothetical protein
LRKLRATTLKPGESTTGTGSYTIKSEDVSAGKVINIAYATGIYNNQQVTSSPDSATVTKESSNSVPEFPSIALPVAAIVGILIIVSRRNNE